MYLKILAAFRTHTFRQSVVTVISTFLAAGLGAVFYLILARQIGPHDYGLFALALAILGVTLSVADLGITQGLVRFVGSNARDNKYYPYVKLAFQWKIIMGIAAGMVFGLGPGFLATNIFHQPELKGLLPLVGLAIFSQLLFSLMTSVFQALQKFVQWGILQVGANVIRLTLLLPLLFVGKLNSSTALLIFFLSYLMGFGISWIWLDKNWLKSKVLSIQKKEFWGFNRWTAVMAVSISLTSRLDILLTGRFLSLSDVGVYSLATTMVSFLPQLASAVGTVTTAKFAGMKDRQHEKNYLCKSLLFVGGISVVIGLAMIPVALIVLRITGHDYSGSFVPFLILLVSMVIYMFTNPIRDSILYFHGKPKFFVFLNIIQATAVILSGFWLIPRFGVIGSAAAVAISLGVCGVTTIVYHLILRQTPELVE